MAKSGNLGWSQNETRPEHPVSSVLCQFCGHLGWVKSLKWCQGKGVSTQWGRGRFSEWGWGRGSSPWGCRITCAKWHHEWLFELTRRHSWCHLVKVILYPQGREPLPQPHSQKCSPHWVETLLPCHHFRDSSQPRCTQNWHKTDETWVVMSCFILWPPHVPRRGHKSIFWSVHECWVSPDSVLWAGWPGAQESWFCSNFNGTAPRQGERAFWPTLPISSKSKMKN